MRPMQFCVEMWFYPDGSLSLAKRIPSGYENLCRRDETFTILPSFLLARAVFLMVSISKFVSRKWPAISVSSIKKTHHTIDSIGLIKLFCIHLTVSSSHHLELKRNPPTHDCACSPMQISEKYRQRWKQEAF